MIKMGLVGVGKMGISHLAILGAHPQIDLVAICDSATYITSVLRKHNGISTYKDFGKMLKECELDGLFIATPTSSHFDLAKTALENGLHFFVEKPLCLNAAQPGSFALKPGSRGHGAAECIPNFNDGYPRPDVGAHQSGTGPCASALVRPAQGQMRRLRSARGKVAR
jgi:hypothetical protein